MATSSASGHRGMAFSSAAKTGASLCIYLSGVACCLAKLKHYEQYQVATDCKPTLLFKHKESSVNVTIYGPPIGFRWTRVEYFRWVQSTKEPGQWEKRPPDRETDQVHLEHCVKLVRKWFQQRDRAHCWKSLP